MPGETEMATIPGAPAVKPVRHMEDIESQNSDDTETKKKKEFERTLWTRIWQGTAGAAIVINIISFVAYFGAVTLVAGLIGIGVSAAVIKFQMELQDTDSLRQTQNDLRHEVNDFAVENNKLSNSNKRLESQLAPLKATEEKLAKIAEENGSNVNKLRQLVKDNQRFIDEAKELVEADVVYQMIDAVLDSEKSEDGHFSDREIRILAIRLNGLPAITVDREKFMERVKEQRSINSVVSLMRTINNKDIPEDERIFTINEDFEPTEED